MLFNRRQFLVFLAAAGTTVGCSQIPGLNTPETVADMLRHYDFDPVFPPPLTTAELGSAAYSLMEVSPIEGAVPRDADNAITIVDIEVGDSEKMRQHGLEMTHGVNVVRGVVSGVLEADSNAPYALAIHTSRLLPFSREMERLLKDERVKSGEVVFVAAFGVSDEPGKRSAHRRQMNMSLLEEAKPIVFNASGNDGLETEYTDSSPLRHGPRSAIIGAVEGMYLIGENGVATDHPTSHHLVAQSERNPLFCTAVGKIPAATTAGYPDGTSNAAATMAAFYAELQEREGLTYEEAMYVFCASAIKENITQGTGIDNGVVFISNEAGFAYAQEVGYGVVDIEAALVLARELNQIKSQMQQKTEFRQEVVTLSADDFERDSAGNLVYTIPVSSPVMLQKLQVDAFLEGVSEMEIISPSGASGNIRNSLLGPVSVQNFMGETLSSGDEITITLPGEVSLQAPLEVKINGVNPDSPLMVLQECLQERGDLVVPDWARKRPPPVPSTNASNFEPLGRLAGFVKDRFGVNI